MESPSESLQKDHHDGTCLVYYKIVKAGGFKTGTAPHHQLLFKLHPTHIQAFNSTNSEVF